MPRWAQDNSADEFVELARSWRTRLIEHSVAGRIASRDASLWSTDVAIQELVAHRLGWVGNAGAPAEIAAAEGSVLLLGMGGSSLGAEAVARAFRTDRLHIVDSTVPDAVRGAADLLAEASDVVVASKSGGTLETAALADFFEAHARAGTRFHAVTDPGSDLATRAQERGYASVHRNDPDIGGRFSVLSLFGTVPLRLAGVDVGALHQHAADAVERCSADSDHNPGLWLGAALAAAAGSGRDKMYLVAESGLEGLADWIEQLVAESTGKQGEGILPVVLPAGEAPRADGDAFAVFLEWAGSEAAAERQMPTIPAIHCPVDGPAGLGAEFYVWQVATAVVGHALGINPFDEPNVAAAKRRTREALEQGAGLAADSGSNWDVIDGSRHDLDAFAECPPGGYSAILAFLASDARATPDLLRMRSVLGRVGPATLGWGPRYLHSSGQLHKGGPAGGRFLVVTAAQEDLAVPGGERSFGAIAQAQAIGDVAALRESGRDAVHVHIDGGLETGLSEIVNYLEQRIPQQVEDKR